VTVIPPSIRSDGQDPDDNEEDAMFLLITTGGDGEAKLWTLSSTILINGPQRASDGQGFRRAIVHVGNLALNTSGAHGKRVSGAIAHHYTLRGGISGIAIVFQVGDRSVEVWRIRSVEEVKKKQARRKKKEASKSRKSDEKNDVTEPEQSVTWLDRLCPWIMLRGSGKISSFAFPPTSNLVLFPSADRPTELQILLALSNNSVEIMSIPRPTTSAKWASLEAENLYKVAMPGHRTDVRTVSLSFDDQLLASGSNGSLKVWNLKTQKCIRTMECGYALCSTWLPGNKHVSLLIAT
jgi:U3 small nucleolar RNA-associated protein 12